jgi:hypothetical protein
MQGQDVMLGVLAKIALEAKDADLGALAVAVRDKIIEHKELEVGISEKDYESITFTDEQGRTLITTLGRLMTRRLGYDPYKYSLLIQVLTDAYLAEIRKFNVSFDVVLGKYITDAYKEEWGAHSCMTGSYAAYTKFLAKNKQAVQMLLFKDKAVKARALLWTTNEGDKVLDRIYPNSGYHVAMMQKWATDQGFIYRANNSLPSGLTVMLSNKKTYSVSITNLDDIWSYMDTFTFGKGTQPHYTLTNGYDSSCSFDLQTTGGARNNYPTCHHCSVVLGPLDDIYEAYLGVGTIKRLFCESCKGSVVLQCQGCKREVYAPNDKSDAFYCLDCKTKMASVA